MSTIQPPEGLSATDFEAIEAAVTETVRGRWFLAEFARRIRAQDTEKVLSALTRLEHLVTSERAQCVPLELHVYAALETASERLREIACGLRDRGLDPDICGLIENEACTLARLQHDTPAELTNRSRADQASLAEGTNEGHPRSLIERIEKMRPLMPRPLATVQTSTSAAPRPEADRVLRTLGLSEIDALPFREKLLFFA